MPPPKKPAPKKKAATKKAATKKPAPKKKAATKKAATKKPATKKAATKKAATKKAATKKATSKKATSKKGASKKPGFLRLNALPVLWAVRAPGQAIGIHVDDREVWAGYTTGAVVACDHEGAVLRQWQLPAGVDALSADEAWRYAGCHDGKVYDLTARTPRVAYEVEGSARVHWVEVFDGKLCVGDASGALSVFDVDGQLQFRVQAKRARGAWMVRADDSGVYVGNSHTVTKVTWQGKKRWSTPVQPVGFGWQEADAVYALEGCEYGDDPALVVLDKATGKVRARSSCVTTEPYYDRRHNACACAAGRGGDIAFGATCDALFAFDRQGNKLWQTPMTRIGAPCSMAYHAPAAGRERLYVVTSNGLLACLDVSDAAVQKAVGKSGKMAKAVPLPKAQAAAKTVEETRDDSTGVVLECVDDGGKLRVRVVSPGHHADWYCQFPRDIRVAGARYVVDEVREARQGGFYRAYGEIKRLRS